MASGFGLNGGTSRCFPFWQEVLACYVTNTDSADDSGKKKCGPILEDYYECLHHKKEHRRVSNLQLAYRKRLASSDHPRTEHPTAGQIRSFGLLVAEEDKEKPVDRWWDKTNTEEDAKRIQAARDWDTKRRDSMRQQSS